MSFRVIYNRQEEAIDHKTAFAQTLEELMREDPRVCYLDADLMNSSGTFKLWKAHPDRIFNVGIAEANMMGIAGGLSAQGKIPYVHTFAPFASRRSFDQTFISIAYAGNHAIIYGSDAGITAEFNGGTHMPFEDMALMRSIPGATVVDPADSVQFRSILRSAKDMSGVVYIRSSRKKHAALYAEGSEFEIGKGVVIKDGRDLTIIACGFMLAEALEAAALLEKEGVSIRVLDMFTVKPLDTELVIRCAEETGAIVTAENHNIIGGLGEAVAAALCENRPVPMKRHGVEDRFGQVGPVSYLRDVYGLGAEALAASCRSVLARKKN